MKRYSLPSHTSSLKDVEADLDRLSAQMTSGESGKLASTAFWGDAEMKAAMSAAYERFQGWNALFTFQEAAAAKMENDVIDICVGLGHEIPGPILRTPKLSRHIQSMQHCTKLPKFLILNW